MRLSISLLVILTAGGLVETRRAPAADPKVTTNLALQVQFRAEKGQFYQLEVAASATSTWKAFGPPTKGYGQEVVRSISLKTPTKPLFRVRTLQSQWVRVWSDEFTGIRLDTTKWSKEENGYGGGNNERQFYSTNPKYCYVKNGQLHIAVHRDPNTTTDGKTQPYSSARIRSLHRGDWKYGRFEVRAKVPGGQGIWPAVWMMPTNSKYGTWAASGEIDILESRGSKVSETTAAIHFGGKWPRNRFLVKAYTFPKKNAAEAFHIYVMEWDKNQIRWYVDGVKFQTRTRKEWFSEAAEKRSGAPFDQPFHLILNVAVDGRFFKGTGQQADKLSASAFPQVFLVDYVRVYQWAGSQK